jgi:hypothetical protein
MKSPGSVVQVGRVAFELSRFELARDCCQVEGRWFGVRGRRFMRPALTVDVDGQPVRLLADLADKPWAAEDGEPWKATFPYTIEPAHARDAELTVAPDLTITLPAPKRLAPGAEEKSAARPTDGPRRRGLRRPGSGSDVSAGAAVGRSDRPRGGSRSSAVEGGTDAAGALTRELANLRDSQRQLRQRLDRAEAGKAKTAERLQEVSGELREAIREREELSSARDQIAAELEAARRERGDFVAERDTALRERHRLEADRQAAQRTHDAALQASDAAGAARDRALSERGAALAAEHQAASERDLASAARDQAVTERDSALSRRDHALAERDAAVAARDQAVSSREELSGTTERLQSELADLRSARGAALVMRGAAQAPAVSRRYARLSPGAITITLLLAIALILVILLRVV